MKYPQSTIYDLRSKLKGGFTLIELLVVISIIGILIAVGSVSYLRAVKLSRDSKRKTDLEQIRQALETYRSENGLYPPDTTTLKTGGYIATLPTDPKEDGTTYTYAYTQLTTTTYKLCDNLEAAAVVNYCVYAP